jgi:hypothetical protein
MTEGIEKTTFKEGDTFRFTVEITGTLEGGHLKVSGDVVGADGTVTENGKVKERDVENIAVALYDGGVFLQSLSLSLGLVIASATGDVKSVLGIMALAHDLGVPLAQNMAESVTEP